MSQELLIKLFEDNQIRVIWDEGKEDYFFCVNDIVTALTGTVDSSNYLKQLRHRDAELSKGWLQIVPPFSRYSWRHLKDEFFNTGGYLPYILFPGLLCGDWRRSA